MPLLLAAALLLQPQVAILAYHQVESEPKLGWSVSVEDFTDQMHFLRVAGFHVVSIADAYDYLAGKRDSLPPNPVVITVDDGFVDAYTNIRPALARFRYPWSLYIYPRFISRGATALAWDQVLELSAAGVDVESHTMNHPHLMHRSHPEMSDADYSSWLNDELAGSKSAIEEKTKKTVRFLAYPYGDYDKTVEEASARAGYLVGLTSWAGLNARTADRFALRRFPMTSDTTLQQFAEGVGAGPLDLRQVYPPNGSVSTSSQISAMVGASDLDPATVRIEMLGEKATGSFDAATGRVTATIARFTRPRQHVIVYGERASDHRPVAAAWTFYTSAEAKERYESAARRLRELPLHHDHTKRQ